MKFDHFIPCLSPEGDFTVDKLSSLAWQSVVDAMHWPDTIVEVQPFATCYPNIELSLPEPFAEKLVYSNTSNRYAPLLSDLLTIINEHGDSEWVVISHPDVMIKQNFYSIIEHYIVSGHDAIAVSTSNTIAPDLALIRRGGLMGHTWQVSGYSNHIDSFIFSRSYLEDFHTPNVHASLPYAAEALFANLLRHSNRFKFLYEDSITCRFNNVLFWEINNRYNKLIRDNYRQAQKIFSELNFTEEQKKSENYRRLELRLESRKRTASNFNRTSEGDFYRNINIKKCPVELPGTSWAITTYFNPSDSRKILENYRNFAKNLRAQGVPLLTVELSFKPGVFSLFSEDSDKLVQIDDGSIMWQKERMFNLALKYLPDNCDKVIYMDADIVFSDKNWLVNTENLLSEYCFVQPFSHVVRLPKDAKMLELASYEAGWEDGQAIHSFAWGLEKFGDRALRNYPHHGTVGIALAARRSIMETHGWFDADVVGSGDLLTIDSIFSIHSFRSELMNPKFKNYFYNWHKGFHEEVKNSLVYAPGIVYHYWHGNSKNRFYQQRHRVLEDYEFDPNKDIQISEQGVWKWSSDKELLHSGVKKYFFHRDDD